MSIFSVFESGGGSEGLDLGGLLGSDSSEGGFLSEVGNIFSGSESNPLSFTGFSGDSACGTLPELSLTGDSGMDAGSITSGSGGSLDLSSIVGGNGGGLDLGSILGCVGGSGGLDIGSLFGGQNGGAGLGLGSILGQGGGFDLSSITSALPAMDMLPGMNGSFGAGFIFGGSSGGIDLGSLVGGSQVGGMCDNLPIAQDSGLSTGSYNDGNLTVSGRESEISKAQQSGGALKSIFTVAGGVVGACYGSPTLGAAAGSMVGGVVEGVV